MLNQRSKKCRRPYYLPKSFALFSSFTGLDFHLHSDSLPWVKDAQLKVWSQITDWVRIVENIIFSRQHSWNYDLEDISEVSFVGILKVSMFPVVG